MGTPGPQAVQPGGEGPSLGPGPRPCSHVPSLCCPLPPVTGSVTMSLHVSVWLCPHLCSDLGFRGLGSVLTWLGFPLLPGEERGSPWVTERCDKDRGPAGLAQGHLPQQLSPEGGLQGQGGPCLLRGSGRFRLEEWAPGGSEGGGASRERVAEGSGGPIFLGSGWALLPAGACGREPLDPDTDPSLDPGPSSAPAFAPAGAVRKLGHQLLPPCDPIQGVSLLSLPTSVHCPQS